MAMSPADIAATTAGINESMSLFYTVGGSILVVCAGIWGFNRIRFLLVEDLDTGNENYQNYTERKKHSS